MHVVSASRRTDIPAFHSEWFMNRIRAGYVKVVSPFGGRVFEVSLLPEQVIAIVFWTKDAGPLLPFLGELFHLGHCFTFLYTINNYPSFLEPRAPQLSHTLKVVEAIRKKFPLAIVRWRYDTIVLTKTLDQRWHIDNFRKLCQLMTPFTTECIFSFCDYYKKTIRNMERMVPDHFRPDGAYSKKLAEEMALVAADHGISFQSCAHDLLVSERIGKARCIDPVKLAEVVDSTERHRALGKLKLVPSRRECGCAESRDIGAYDTCGHGCVYCYANAEPIAARSNVRMISSESDCLALRSNSGAKRTDRALS